MGIIISTFMKIFPPFSLLPFSETPSRILMLGLDAAGKTTLLYKFKLGEVVTTIPTIGFNVETVKHNNTSFTVWDVGFRDKMIPLWRHYYEGTDAVIFVVDSTDAERMEEAKDILERILNENDGKLQNTPLLVLSNKVDLPGSKNTTEVTDKLCLHKLRDREWFIQETCGLTGEGIVDGFEWLAKNIKNKNVLN